MYENFSDDFKRFIPIVIKASGKYKIRGFDKDDYIQEGMLIYFELLHKEIDEKSLPVFFKVKYTQHLVNLIRHQKAYKRSFDEGNYVDIHSVSSHVADQAMSIESKLLISDTMTCFIEQLKKNDQRLLLNLVDGHEISRVQKYRLKQKLIQFLKDNTD
ncbi:MAG: hypothetical protein LBI13_04825 [Streptococcaceae bacterium]|jgi:competence protein ComX|nr:hypothetical protein [Streptococcaceae bacterium]